MPLLLSTTGTATPPQKQQQKQQPHLVTLLLDDCLQPCLKVKLYSGNINFQKLRKFRIDHIALYYKKREYIECLCSHDDHNCSIRLFIGKHPLIETNDFEYMKKIVLFRGWLIRYASKQLTSDASFMFQVVKEHQNCYRYASDELRSDRKLLETALDLSGCGNDLFRVLEKVDFCDFSGGGIVGLFRFPTRLFRYVTCEKLRNDHELKRKAKEIKLNRELVLQAVKYHGSVLRYVNSKFKSDIEVVVTAMENDELNVMRWATEDVLNSYELTIRLVTNIQKNMQFAQLFKKQGEAFWRKVVELKLLPPILIPKKFFNIREIVIYAVENDASALRYAFDGSAEIDDEEILKLAITHHPTSIKWASERLRNNLEIMLLVLKRNPELIVLASEEIRKSVKVAKIVLTQNIELLKYFHESIRKDTDLLLNLPVDVAAINSSPIEVRSNRDFIENLVKKKFLFFSCATPELRDDMEYVKKLFDINSGILTYISDNLKNNIDLMRFVTERNALLFTKFSRILRSRFDIIKECVDLAFKQGLLLDPIYENIICHSFGKVEFRNELILLHQLFKENSKTSSLRYAHPMLFFDKEYFDEIYGDSSKLDYFGELAFACIYPSPKSLKDLRFLLSDRGQIFQSNIYNLIEGLYAYFDMRHSDALVNLAICYSKEISFEMLNEDLLKNNEFINEITLYNRGLKVLDYVQPPTLSNNVIFNILTKRHFIDKKITQRLLVHLNDDREFMTSVISRNHSLLGHASERLRDDEKFIIEAISWDSFALSYASDRLKNSKEIVKMAVRVSASAFIYASEELKNDLEFVRSLIDLTGQYSFLYEHASPHVKKSLNI